ncbi:ribbon-helix-helix domain-containing protein [Sinorhizobium meliloti]|uniref:ribbon-helix-helix domain-containing protein n=1 Tax=Rhizobium meliloti TaxID=382 RepID=UPI000FD2104D|nr:type II toxin-antitoxin system ParD family antitoxin [Sinorhizobium meliloti]RVM02533.1 type II toxin-antitoxin system ParD family antitoxin [Sinorhizobium meliloti]RVM39512.1 type II toxin-antitoxin system ParD family antitoxin [Sinorhizobium meliloti]RVM55592.1 type II toxin-antitoxin system ParD family antitoxin [Sinorhizobium meliloti]RVM59513.1 type II toxin-antitoxin system ParD family antitoxin [Sinorhizobium meliloti]RVM75923.1 type II toxin-antitoxin system ParD family antitoxin [S
MSVKSSISLTDQQDAFARSLVESGRYSSMSSVLQQGLELLRQKTETETVETAALGELVRRRLNGPMISATEMESRVAAMIERKRLVVRVDS